MVNGRALPALGQAVSRIRSLIYASNEGKYLPRIVQNGLRRPEFVKLSPQEFIARSVALQKHQEQQVHQESAQVPYVAFVRALYPVKNRLTRLETGSVFHTQINHNTLFKSYCELPGVACIKHTDLEEFMSNMLYRRDFVKPAQLSLSSIDHLKPLAILRAYESGIELRKKHLSMCWKVFEDLKKAGIPLSLHEQNNLIFMNFYVDRKDIRDKVEIALDSIHKNHPDYQHFHALVKEQTTKFNMHTYKQLREQFEELLIDSFNILLFTALRHELLVAVEDLQSLISLLKIIPNGKTFRILLDHHGMHGDVEGFVSVLEQISAIDIDIKLVNSIVNGVVGLGHPEMAEMIIQSLMDREADELESNELFLKLLTFQDQLEYARRMLAYESMEQKELMKLHATEDTILPLLRFYCSNGNSTSFETINRLLFYMETVFALPITTRVFSFIFETFTTSNYALEDLIQVTGKLLSLHDSYYAMSDDIRLKDKVGRIEMPKNLVDMITDVMIPAPSDVPSNQGTFIKLLDTLVRLIYDAFIARVEDVELKEKIFQQKETLFERLQDIEQSSPNGEGPSPRNLYLRDELVYIKKGFIIELLDICT